MNIIRRDPFREMMTLRNAMDRLFDSAFVGPSVGLDQVQSWDLALDVTENADEYVVKASLPGMNPDDLEVTYNNNTLTIKGEIKAEEHKEGEHYHLRERRWGSFSRSVTLPSNINANQISASYENGVLKLRLPKAEEAKPKRITVNTFGDKVIEGKAAKNGGK
jgi:HSP20 family protein